MRTVVITPPAGPLIDASVVRARLGLTAAVTDDTINAFVAAASQPLDGPEGWLGRALGPQTLEMRADAFPWFGWDVSGGCDTARWDAGCAYVPAGYAGPVIKLDCPPIVSISSVTYVDGAGIVQTLDPSKFELDGRNLAPTFGNTWPSARLQTNAVRVRYQAGYDVGKIPAPILQAIVMSVASMNAMTKADPGLATDTVIGVSSKSWQPGADIGGIYQKAAQSLLGSYRVID